MPRRYSISTVVLATIVFTAVIGVGVTQAYSLHGCEYDNNSIEPISYRFYSVGATYETAFTSGQAAWDGTPSPGTFTENSTSLDPEINVTDGDFDMGWYASATWGCNDGLYTGNEVNIKFDTENMAGLSAHEKKIVAEHELGHAYGLADVSTGCRVMRIGTAFTCGTMPAQDDIDGVNAVY